MQALGRRQQAHGLEETNALRRHCILGAQKRCLVINAVAEMRHKGAWDAECAFVNEWGRGAVPHCERGRCVRHTEPSIGKRGAVGLPLKEALIGQSREEGLVAIFAGEIQVDQSVILESSNGTTRSTAAAAAWEKPMREVGRTMLPRPLEQCLRDGFLIAARSGCASNQSLRK